MLLERIDSTLSGLRWEEYGGVQCDDFAILGLESSRTSRSAGLLHAFLCYACGQLRAAVSKS